MKTITAKCTPTATTPKFFARFPETALTNNELQCVKGGDDEQADPIIPSGNDGNTGG